MEQGISLVVDILFWGAMGYALSEGIWHLGMAWWHHRSRSPS